MLPWLGRLADLPAYAVRRSWHIAGQLWKVASYVVIDPIATLSAGTATALMPDTVITAFNDGLTPMIVGRRIEMRFRDRDVEGILRRLELKRAGARLLVRGVFDEVRWSGLTVTQLRAVAEGVQVVPSVPARISAERIEMRGDIRAEDLVTWLNGKGLSWEFYATDPGPRLFEAGPDHLVAVHRQRKIRAVIDASVTDDTVHVKVVRGRWRGLRLPKTKLTSWAFPLSPLPNDVRILHARRSGEMVHVVLDLPAVKGKIDLAQMRDAVIAGTRYVIP
jgi:hypothetical protein